MLTPNPGLIIWTIITFILLLLVLRKLAWKPLLDALHRREDSVQTAISSAEHARDEAEKLLKEHRRQLDQVEQEGRRILAEHRSQANQLKEEIVQQANNQSRKLIEQARVEIERDKEAALVQLRSEVAGLAIQAAEKILGEELNEQRHRAIIDTYLRELPKN